VFSCFCLGAAAFGALFYQKPVVLPLWTLKGAAQ